MAQHNNSLDASGTSGFVIDNLIVAQLFAAASTQMFGRIAMWKTHKGARGLTASENARLLDRLVDWYSEP